MLGKIAYVADKVIAMYMEIFVVTLLNVVLKQYTKIRYWKAEFRNMNKSK